MSADFLKMYAEKYGNVKGGVPVVDIAPPSSEPKGIKTSTVVAAISLAVVVVASVVVAIVVINNNAERKHNANLVRLDDDSDWKDLSEDGYSDKLRKSKSLRDEGSDDPNFTLLSDIERK